MPELPEVETVRRGLEPLLIGRKINRIVIDETRLRYPVAEQEFIRTLVGTTIKKIERRGKYLLIACGARTTLLSHLGMTGRFQFCSPQTAKALHTHATFFLSGRQELRYIDPRRFGMLESVANDRLQQHPLLCNLGPEPLCSAFDADYLHAKCRKRQRPIKNFIMDANIVVGVGNIYASEALHLSGIHPHRAAGRLSRERIDLLVAAIKGVLDRAIKVGGTTLRDFLDPSEEAGYFAIKLTVYDREGEPCKTCEVPIRRSIQSNRSTFYCPKCQR
ncbi:MAG: formamidopyrimidine-DNA glycosylase [Planctomycetota bacterium]|jgi:formamidopyrimidine-DNA glycosylase